MQSKWRYRFFLFFASTMNAIPSVWMSFYPKIDWLSEKTFHILCHYFMCHDRKIVKMHANQIDRMLTWYRRGKKIRSPAFTAIRRHYINTKCDSTEIIQYILHIFRFKKSKIPIEWGAIEFHWISNSSIQITWDIHLLTFMLHVFQNNAFVIFLQNIIHIIDVYQIWCNETKLQKWFWWNKSVIFVHIVYTTFMYTKHLSLQIVKWFRNCISTEKIIENPNSHKNSNKFTYTHTVTSNSVDLSRQNIKEISNLLFGFLYSFTYLFSYLFFFRYDLPGI